MSEKQRRDKDEERLRELYSAIEPARNDDIAREAVVIAHRWIIKAENQSKQINNLEERYRRFSKKIRNENQGPPAQPEIIHCGDCKYKDDGIDEGGIPFLKCLNGRSYGGTRINDYCSWAERRQDG